MLAKSETAFLPVILRYGYCITNYHLMNGFLIGIKTSYLGSVDVDLYIFAAFIGYLRI